MAHIIHQENCIGCGSCAKTCPVDAITKEGGKYTINASECVSCQACWRVCPEKCIEGMIDCLAK